MFLELATALLVIAQLVAQQLAQQPPLSPPAQLRHHHVPVANHTFASSNPYHNNVVGQLPQQRTFYYYYNQNYRYPCMSRCPYPYRWISSYNGHRSSSSAGQPRQPPTASVQGAYVRLILPPATPSTTTTTTATITKTTQVQISTTSPAPTTTMANNFVAGNSVTSSYPLPTPPPYNPQQNLPTGPDPSSLIVRLNPCAHGRPLINELRNPTTCNFVVKPNGGCPEDHWCHTGSSYETTTCCPATGGYLKDRCQLPKSIGDGEDLIPRWHFDSGARKCKRFLYKGMRGNANNFVTAMSCMEACETANNAAVADPNPCANGPPARDLNGEQFTCGHSDARCPAGYYCHLGTDSDNAGDNSPATTTNVCCELSAAASDRCHLTLRIGDGQAKLSRFYFNTVTRRCEEFLYKGAKGNENQFLTMAECRKECEKPPNPCPVLFDFGIRKKECQGEQQQCAKGEWCHQGSSPETTACCAGAVNDPCKLPLDLGQGLENLTRWYAIPSEDACQRECRPFQYRGMKGNQNNYRTKADCEANCKAECPSALNPCGADTDLLLDPEGRAQRCNGTGHACPADYWCHVGPGAETTVCCSGATRSCALPLAEGFGNALLSRWFYNASEGNCRRFIYRGIGGNQNNYVDYEECMNACPDDAEELTLTPTATTRAVASATTAQSPSQSPPIPNPCGTGSPLATSAHDATPRECSPRKRCPATHFCHIGGDADRLPNMCCPKNGDPCAQPLAEGDGPFELARHHFDPLTRRCRPFVYRGAGGNANNFLTAEDCQLVCPSTPTTSSSSAAVPEPDQQPRGKVVAEGVNPCPEGEPLTDDQGQALVCGGGASGLFAASSVVAARLSAAHAHQLRSGCPVGWWCHVGAGPLTTNCCPDSQGSPGPCEQPLALGTGTQRLDRWYFDAEAQACRRFWYTGAKGNANNFVSLAHCQDACPEMAMANFGQPNNNNVVVAAQHWTTTTTATTSAPVDAPESCLRGNLLRDNHGQPLQCRQDPTDMACPAATHFCHIGHRPSQSGCCPRTSPATDPCLLPMNRGISTDSTQVIRWHFNAATRSCEAFDYAGQLGNENNFVTKRLCEEQCRRRGRPPTEEASPPPPLSPQVQHCPHGEPKWDANGRATKCGPDNTCPEGYVCHVNHESGMAICCENPAHFCLQARERGPCHGDHLRYGYNPLTDTCVPYRYSGCGGTLNRFESAERCTEICCRQYRQRK